MLVVPDLVPEVPGSTAMAMQQDCVVTVGALSFTPPPDASYAVYITPPRGAGVEAWGELCIEWVGVTPLGRISVHVPSPPPARLPLVLKEPGPSRTSSQLQLMSS